MPPAIKGENGNQRSSPPLQILNFIAIAISIALIAGFLFAFIVRAFEVSPRYGLQSLSASLLPLICITYIVFYTEIFRAPDRIPPFNVYFFFTIWTLILFILARFFYNAQFPVTELIFSFTLGFIMTISRYTEFRVFLSCAYGILSGFLLYIAFIAFLPGR